jgi:two-component system sensor histidine kinase TctE
MPSELQPLVDALNRSTGRIQSMLQARRRFFDDAAHQLKTPLAVMQVQAELALREGGVVEIRAQVAALLKTLEGAIKAVRGMLSLARLEPDSGRAHVLQESDLGELAREVALDWAPFARAHEVDIEFDACRPAPAWLEPNLVPDLIGNLIDNAVRHGGSVCRLRVALGDACTTLLSVEDNGPGIPLPERENVFKRFYRIAGTPTDGSGLGLAIVREIARVHGAAITLGSAGGVGLCVQVAFRRSADVVRRAPAATRPESGLKAGAS